MRFGDPARYSLLHDVRSPDTLTEGRDGSACRRSATLISDRNRRR